MTVKRAWRPRLALGVLTAVGLLAATVGSGVVAPQRVAASGSQPGPWTIVPSPSQDGPALSALSAVTCVGAGDCWAVGWSTESTGVEDTLIEHDTGSGWSIVASTPPSGSEASSLSAVTCVSAVDCWVAGSSVDADGNQDALVEQYDGSAWAVVGSPNPTGGTDVSLAGVACPSATDCWAVGTYWDSSDAEQALIEQYTGAGWSVVPSAALPAGGTVPSLSGVTCSSLTDCWAVGSYWDSSDDQNALMEHYAGAGWSFVAGAILPAGSSSADGVTCVGATDCWAVGWYYNSNSEVEAALIEQDTGSGWALVAGASLSSADSPILTGVSCASAGECWAAGYDENGSAITTTLTEEYSGGSWSLIDGAALPAGSSDGTLAGVACPSASDCWTAGSYVTGSYSYMTLTEQDTGSGWSIVFSPEPSVPTSSLLAEACVTASDCWAVGSYIDGGGTEQTLVEQDAGGGWFIVSSPDPSGGTQVMLSGVACESAADCWAVGSYTDSGGSGVPLLEEETGGAWSIVSGPGLPSGATSGGLDGVACVSAGDCWAVGSYTDSTGDKDTLTEQNTGSGWGITASPNPAGSYDTSLAAVACVTSTNCWAAGYYYESTGFKTLIEQYAGSGWAVVPSGTPDGVQVASLTGLTCASATDCWAVGSYYLQGTGSAITLIEQDSGSGWSIVSSPSPQTSSVPNHPKAQRAETAAEGDGSAAKPPVPGVVDGGAPQSGSGLQRCGLLQSRLTAAGGGEHPCARLSDTPPLIEQDTGSGWAVVASPDPAGSTNSYLNGVSSSQAPWCVRRSAPPTEAPWWSRPSPARRTRPRA